LYWNGGPGTAYTNVITGSALFTGQHANEIVDNNITMSTLKDYVGLITSSADEGYVSYRGDGVRKTGSNAIWTTECLPKIKLTTEDKDPAVWGVITNHVSDKYGTDGNAILDDSEEWGNGLTNTVRVNGVGEGAIWVTNINGEFRNGDFICSSSIPGYGRRQDDDIHHSYTVAKITMSCKFELDQSNYRCEEFTHNGQTYRKAYVGCVYHCS
jgi:hypothetical protein